MNVTTPVSSPALDPAKFRDPDVTATGERRASVDLESLETLWFNTGTLCNLTCSNCYIESSPKNDRLVYISVAEVRTYLTEIAALQLPTREIAFTGGEPFMNPEITTAGTRVMYLPRRNRAIASNRPAVSSKTRVMKWLSVR